MKATLICLLIVTLYAKRKAIACWVMGHPNIEYAEWGCRKRCTYCKSEWSARY